MKKQAADIDPVSFIDAEVIKAKLETVLESQDRIEGRLEAIEATLSAKTQRADVREEIK